MTTNPGQPTDKQGKRGWHRPRLLLQAGALAGVAVLAGAAIPALASGGSAPVTYYACVTTKTGAVKIVSNTAKCGTGQHKISWNSVGPRGLTGGRGPAGKRGAQGPAGLVRGYIDNSGGADLTNSSLTTVGTLPLPAGKFLITAKVDAAIGSSNNGDDVVSCDLTDSNGNTLDTTGVTLIPGLDDAAGWGMTMLGATTLTATGSVQVLCANGTGPGGGSAGSVVITAVPVAKIVQSFG
jgi:hypothetical protein